MASIALMVLALALIGSGMLLCLWAVASLASGQLNAFVVEQATSEAERVVADVPAPCEPAD